MPPFIIIGGMSFDDMVFIVVLLGLGDCDWHVVCGQMNKIQQNFLFFLGDGRSIDTIHRAPKIRALKSSLQRWAGILHSSISKMTSGKFVLGPLSEQDWLWKSE
jgi:hypothetical protein